MHSAFYQIPDAPSIALLSDLHNTDPADLLTNLRKHSPSIICIAGDVIYGSWPENDISPLETQENVLPFLEGCASIAPTFLSLGNHELYLDAADLAAMSDTGVTVLDNSWIEKDGLLIGGLTSGYVTDYRKYRNEVTSSSRYPRRECLSGVGGLRTAGKHRPETEWLQSFAAADKYKVLLCHHPEYYPLIPPSVNLVLSGHAHGGQIGYYSFQHRRWAGLWAPGQGWFPRYSKGLYDGRLVVSAGLSNTTWVPRLFNPRECVYINTSKA